MVGYMHYYGNIGDYLENVKEPDSFTLITSGNQILSYKKASFYQKYSNFFIKRVEDLVGEVNDPGGLQCCKKSAIGFLAQPFLLSIKCYPGENAEYRTVNVDVISS